jgi:hypothetical protein
VILFTYNIAKGGNRMPEAKSKSMFTTSIDAELKKEFKIVCALNNLYQNEVIEGLIREFIERKKKEGGNNGNSNK